MVGVHLQSNQLMCGEVCPGTSVISDYSLASSRFQPVSTREQRDDKIVLDGLFATQFRDAHISKARRRSLEHGTRMQSEIARSDRAACHHFGEVAPLELPGAGPGEHLLAFRERYFNS